VRPARDAVEPRRHQHRPKLSAPRQGGLEARPAVVLTAGDVGKLRYQRPPLPRHEGPHAGLLRLQAQPALPLLDGRDSVEANRQARGAVLRGAHQADTAAI
jgi:hypothetical protein